LKYFLNYARSPAYGSRAKWEKTDRLKSNDGLTHVNLKVIK